MKMWKDGNLKLEIITVIVSNGGHEIKPYGVAATYF